MFTRDDLIALTSVRPAEGVLSVYARTDPRDPDNTTSDPRWKAEVRNGLRDAVAAAGDADHVERTGVRDLAAGVEAALDGISGADRGRSFAWFLTPDGSFERRIPLQLPVRRTAVAWAPRPLVSPLADVGDRGRATGLALASSERVRLLGWEVGEVTEVGDSELSLDTSGWRQYSGPPKPGSQHAGSHRDVFEARMDDQHERFLAEAAVAVAERIARHGWEYVVIAAEGGVAAPFRRSLPPEAAERVLATVETEIVDREPHVIAERLEPEIEAAREREAAALVTQVTDTTAAGGHAVTGSADTLLALAETRVAHLLVDPAAPVEPGPVDPQVETAMGKLHRSLWPERAIELAIRQDARVTVLDTARTEPPPGGMGALLRY